MTLTYHSSSQSTRSTARDQPAPLGILGSHTIPSVAPRPLAKEVSLVDVEFSPAAVGTVETTALCTVTKGDVVLSVHARKTLLAELIDTNSAALVNGTLSVGDGDDLQRFIPLTQTKTGTADDVVQPIVTSPPTFPYVYPADDTIDIDYAGDTPGTVNPRWRVIIHIIRARSSEGSLHLGER